MTDIEQRVEKVEKDQNSMFWSLFFISLISGVNFGFFVGSVITIYLSS